MQVDLTGIHKVKARGRVYHYAWRGGPRLHSMPGTPEFIAEFQAAIAARPTHHDGTLTALVTAYQATPYFTDKAPATRRDYIRHMRAIESEFGDLPIAALADRRIRGDFMAWRDRMARKSRRQADYAFAVLALIVAWAYDHGRAPANPCTSPGRLYRADRSDAVWTEADEAAFLRAAPPHLGLALTLAIWTGQRQGDLLRLTWSAYDGQTIRMRQSKTGRRVLIPVAAPLRAALDAARETRRAVTLLETTRGTPWTSSGFRASWGKVEAGLDGLTFHDLRGTAVTRLARAGCSVPEIATITGHALKEVEAMLDGHYLSRDNALAESAISKLEKHGTGTGVVKHAVKHSGSVDSAKPKSRDITKG